MARILITSGPTRQYLDPVRYLSNASSGQMGRCLAIAALEAGHDVTVISGPVSIEYPAAATVVPVTTTEDMLIAAQQHFPQCDGVISAAAPCDYQPVSVAVQKLSKSDNQADGRLTLELESTADILATLGEAKQSRQWSVGFALETHDGQRRAVEKLKRKNCDLIVLNGPTAIEANENQVAVIDAAGVVVCKSSGTKEVVAKEILNVITERLISAK